MAHKRFSLLPQSLELGRFWTIPNLLSLLRLILILPVTYLILVEAAFGWMLGLLMAALLTDWLDGQTARWTGSVSEWGKIIDPIADKVGALLVTGALVWQNALPAWFFTVIIARDLIIFVGGVILTRRIGRIVMSTWIGKAAVAAVALTVLAALLEADPHIMQWSLWFSTGLLGLSFLRYLARFIYLLSREQPKRSPEEKEQPMASSKTAAPPNDRTTSDTVVPD